MAALTTFNDLGTSAVACTMPRASYPIPRDTTAVVYSQDFIVPFANYSAPTLGEAHSEFATARCIGDSELQDLGGGVARYTRTWAVVPANRYEYLTRDYQYIGLITTTSGEPPFSQYWNSDPSGARDPEVKATNSRILHEYFLCIAGETYETPDDIPVVGAQTYQLVSNPNAKRTHLLPATGYYSTTTPTTEDYLALIAAETWIVAEDSKLSDYLGQIFCRMTPYVKAL